MYTEYDEMNFNNDMGSKEKKRKKSSFGKKLIATVALALVFGLVSGGVFRFMNPQIGVEQLPQETEEQETKPQVEPVVKPSVNIDEEKEGEYTVPQIAEMILPATVAISCLTQETTNSIWFGQQTQEYTSSGTGFIVGQNDTELLIVTNNHVVSGADQINVAFIDNQEALALIKGTDANNDLAVIAVELSNISGETMGEIAIAELGNSEEVLVGEQVVAVGNALGYGQSVTVGYVSALNRSVTIEGISSNLIQTDAAINPGNSGGALVNMQGQVIGINSAKYSDEKVEGMGYAIPISTAEPIIEKLMNKITRVPVEDSGWMGIGGQNVTQQIAQAYDFPTLGVYIISMEEGGPAEQAGLLKGDLIFEFDDNQITTMESLKNLLTYYEAGETVNLKIYRRESGEYKEKEITITLGSWEDYQGETSENSQQGEEKPGLPYQP